MTNSSISMVSKTIQLGEEDTILTYKGEGNLSLNEVSHLEFKDKGLTRRIIITPLKNALTIFEDFQNVLIHIRLEDNGLGNMKIILKMNGKEKEFDTSLVSCHFILKEDEFNISYQAVDNNHNFISRTNIKIYKED